MKAKRGRQHENEWRRIRPGDDEFAAAESFLREREAFCVGASARFIADTEGGLFKNHGHVWASCGGGRVEALLIHSKSSLYPVFGNSAPRLPRFLGRFIRSVHVYSVQGLREHAEILEQGMESLGRGTPERIDYDLMSLDGRLPEHASAGPPGLVLRPATRLDRDEIYRLHAAYEKEEVILPGGTFNPSGCAATVDRILSGGRILAALVDGRIVGKININAQSFTRFQIGGVYVLPEYRGRGIAVAMSRAFSARLLAEGRGINLFVKKRNVAAAAVYRKAGFVTRGDYRISYF